LPPDAAPRSSEGRPTAPGQEWSLEVNCNEVLEQLGDYLDEDAFWAQVESARERAASNALRIRAGDVQHDPKGDGCPAWCDLWPMCRVGRA